MLTCGKVVERVLFMSGISDLTTLLKSMSPVLTEGEFVFCSVTGKLKEYIEFNPLASFMEEEGLTLVLDKEKAERANLVFNGTFRKITLSVHSSLDAVGLTAKVAEKLASRDISANVIAAFYHDHVFVPEELADAALLALLELVEQS